MLNGQTGAAATAAEMWLQYVKIIEQYERRYSTLPLPLRLRLCPCRCLLHNFFCLRLCLLVLGTCPLPLPQVWVQFCFVLFRFLCLMIQLRVFFKVCCLIDVACTCIYMETCMVPNKFGLQIYRVRPQHLRLSTAYRQQSKNFETFVV